MSKHCLIVAEIAQAHDGSLGTAHAYIDAAAKAGADAVKFQCHIASEESTPAEPWRVAFSRQDATRYDYWKRMEFTLDQWHGLKSHCDDVGLEFICSPFSIRAAEWLTEVGVKRWKIASGELTSLDLMDYLQASGLELVISTGMASFDELDTLVQRLREKQTNFTLLQCTSAYPCPPERVGLNVMQEFRDRYGCPVGLSDHSGTIYPGIAAATLGATFLEVHITFSKDSFGPDVSSSLTLDEFRQLADGVRFIETMNSNPVQKNAEATALSPMRDLFRKSVVVRKDLPVSHVLVESDLISKKPGTGIPSHRLVEFLGRKLKRELKADTLLSEDDLEPA